MDGEEFAAGIMILVFLGCFTLVGYMFVDLAKTSMFKARGECSETTDQRVFTSHGRTWVCKESYHWKEVKSGYIDRKQQ